MFIMSDSRAAIEIENVSRRFGAIVALDNVTLTVHQGEFFSLLGPSGCGKTTLLRILAGHDTPDTGAVRIGGVDAREIPAHKRPVNMVFQSYALFPHMSVWDNIAFGLRMKKKPPDEIAERVRRALDICEIEGLEQRRPAQLSGGQKQRVALARAIINEPQVLLLDEPLGALDLKLRKQLQVELLELQRRLKITFIYVTHDQEEALVMSDRIAVMNNGRIEQMDDAEALYEHPRTRFVAQFLGSCNLLSHGRAIRPEKITLLPPDIPTDEHHLRVRVEEVIYVGAETHYLVRAGDQQLRVEVMNVKPGRQGFDVGQEVIAYLPPEAILTLED